MRITYTFMALLLFIPVDVLSKSTTATVNLSVKFREFTCNITSSRGNNLSFGDVNITTLTLTEGPEIEADLTLTCRLDSATPELTGNNAVTALQSANLRFTSPVSTGGSGGAFLDAGHNVAILPFFNNARMQFNSDYNLKALSGSGYKLKFKLVKKSSSGTISSGSVSVVLNAELTYT
ncbi:fimbrial protein [Citrobacter freundii]|nr:fimbrial protein [Citrobacter freundii]EKX5200475.1 fimbrial protein [Citrobacter freundii]MBQ0243582.1 fimbrial protein [Citrobacter freundii]CAD5352175.1 Fimbrial protein [Citrobacter freundii]HBN5388706.1 fimbrial protein [Citrobacter freundii]